MTEQQIQDYKVLERAKTNIWSSQEAVEYQLDKHLSYFGTGWQENMYNNVCNDIYISLREQIESAFKKAYLEINKHIEKL